MQIRFAIIVFLSLFSYASSSMFVGSGVRAFAKSPARSRPINCDTLLNGERVSRAIDAHYNKLNLKLPRQHHFQFRSYFRAIENNAEKWRDAPFTYGQLQKARAKHGDNFSFKPMMPFLDLVLWQIVGFTHGINFYDEDPSAKMNFPQQVENIKAIEHFRGRALALKKLNAPYYDTWVFMHEYLDFIGGGTNRDDDKFYFLLNRQDVIFYPGYGVFDLGLLVTMASVPVSLFNITLETDRGGIYDPNVFAQHSVDRAYSTFMKRDCALLKYEPYTSRFDHKEISIHDEQFDIARANNLIQSIIRGLENDGLSKEQQRVCMVILRVLFYDENALTYPSRQQLMLSLKKWKRKENLNMIVDNIVMHANLSMDILTHTLSESDMDVIKTSFDILIRQLHKYDEVQWTGNE